MRTGLNFLKAAMVAVCYFSFSLAWFGLPFGDNTASAQIYVDSNVGSSGGGTLLSPYKYLSDIVSIPNNTIIYLKKDGHYPGRLIIPNGRSGVQVTAYGTGTNAPVIQGSLPIEAGAPTVEVGAAWASYPDIPGAWRIELVDGTSVEHIYENEVRATLARYPNTGFMHNAEYTLLPTTGPDYFCGQFTTPNVSRATLEAEEPLPPGLVGSEIVMRTANWQYERKTVYAELGGNTLEIKRFARVDEMDTYNWGLFFQGALSLLNQPGEWVLVCDANETWLYMIPSDGGVSAPTGVRASVHNRGIRIDPNCQGTQITDLAFEHQYEAGITIGANCTNTTVERCYFHELWRGVDDKGGETGDGQVVNDNVFEDTYDTAVLLFSSNSSVTNNVLKRIALVPGLGETGFQGHHGLRVGGDGFTVAWNSLVGIGYAGMNLGGSGVVERNYIGEYMRILNDGAAIQFDNCDGLVIRDNIVSGNALLEDENLESVATDGGALGPFANNRRIAMGIYFGENFIHNTTVQRNTVCGAEKGIHVDHTKCTENAQVLDNTLFNNTEQLSMTDYSNFRSTVQIANPLCLEGGTGNNGGFGLGGLNYRASYTDTYAGNILYCLTNEQRCVAQYHLWPAAYTGAEGAVDFGTFFNNRYFNPFNEVLFSQGVWFNEEDISDYLDDQIIPWTLTGWRAYVEPETEASTTSPLRLLDHDAASQATVPLLSDECNDAGAIARWTVLGYPPPEQIAGDGADGSYLRFVDADWVEKWGSAQQFLLPIDDNGAIISGTYRFIFRMRSADTDAIQLAPIYEEVTPAGSLYEREFLHRGLSPAWKEVVLLAEVDDQTGSDNIVSAYQNLQFSLGPLQGSTIDLDYVRVDRVTLDANYASNVIAADHILRYNCPMDAAANDPLNVYDPITEEGTLIVPGNAGDCWSDVHGNFYAQGYEIELAPWESIVLFKFNVPVSSLAFDPNGVHTVAAGPNPVIWTDHQNIAGSIVVPAGATLVIDGAHIGFAESTPTLTSNVVVQEGGKLIVRNGGLLRNWMGCSAPATMWDGVKVLSYFDPEDGPDATYPGQVDVESGSGIINAYTAILGGDGDPENPLLSSSSINTYGGVINTNGAYFRNNRFDVVAKQWVSPIGTLSPLLQPEACEARMRFINTHFSTNAPLLDPALDPVVHLYGADVELIVHGCTFGNELPSHNSSSEMGHGIQGFNAIVRVEPCETGNCPPASTAGSTFRNLDHAIHCTSSNGNGGLYTSVRDNTFTDNICATYISGMAGVALLDNVVKMGKWYGVAMTHPVEEFWGEHHRGLFTTESWALSIQNNRVSLSTDASANALTEGIVIGYTRDHNELVSENRCTGLTRGFIGEGISADVLGGNTNITGLQMGCNFNDGNAINLLSRKAEAPPLEQLQHTIRGIQGDPATSAGNRFDQTTIDYYISTTAAPITYYYDPNGENPEPVNITEEQDCDLDALPGGVANCEGGGPGIIGGGHTVATLQPLLQANKLAYGNIRYLYEQLIDGGNTDEVVQEIITAWPQDVWELRTYLLERSPFLSVASLKELVNKNWVPVAIKTEICTANPEGTQQEDFIRWAETEAMYPLPAYAIASIVASWDTRTYRFTLQAQMAEKHTAMTQATNHLLYLYPVRTPSTELHPDDVRWIWLQLRTNAARYAEAGLLMRQGRNVEARAVITAMPNERSQKPAEELERLRMLGYMDILFGAADDDRTVYQLNAQEVEALEDLVGIDYDRPAVWASNLLCAAYGICRAPYTGGEFVPKSLQPQVEEAMEDAASARLLIQPNPANIWVAFIYELPGNTDLLQLRVRDASGRVVHSAQAAGTAGQCVWDTRSIAPGAYSVELLQEGSVLHTERLLIQP